MDLSAFEIINLYLNIFQTISKLEQYFYVQEDSDKIKFYFLREEALEEDNLVLIRLSLRVR